MFQDDPFIPDIEPPPPSNEKERGDNLFSWFKGQEQEAAHDLAYEGARKAGLDPFSAAFDRFIETYDPGGPDAFDDRYDHLTDELSKTRRR